MWFLGWPPTDSSSASSSQGTPHLHPGRRRVQPTECTVSMLAASQAVCPKGPPEPPKDPRTLPVPHSDPRGPRVAQRTVHVTHLDSRVPSVHPPLHPRTLHSPPPKPQVGLRLDHPFAFETMGPAPGTQVGQSRAGGGFSRAAQARLAPLPAASSVVPGPPPQGLGSWILVPAPALRPGCIAGFLGKGTGTAH